MGGAPLCCWLHPMISRVTNLVTPISNRARVSAPALAIANYCVSRCSVLPEYFQNFFSVWILLLLLWETVHSPVHPAGICGSRAGTQSTIPSTSSRLSGTGIGRSHVLPVWQKATWPTSPPSVSIRTRNDFHHQLQWPPSHTFTTSDLIYYLIYHLYSDLWSNLESELQICSKRKVTFCTRTGQYGGWGERSGSSGETTSGELSILDNEEHSHLQGVKFLHCSIEWQNT